MCQGEIIIGSSGQVFDGKLISTKVKDIFPVLCVSSFHGSCVRERDSPSERSGR